MTAFIVVDMQVGLFEVGAPRYDADGVVNRINAIAAAVRSAGGHVIFIQHDGKRGSSLEPGSNGWELLPFLDRTPTDLVVRKRASDSFHETELKEAIDRLGAKRVIIGGCATEFCVDTTVRSAASKGYEVIVLSDGHTTCDRSHLDAPTIIKHHNWVWKNLILPRGRVEVAPAEQVIKRL
jgi:nicotinamidase-related amidase